MKTVNVHFLIPQRTLKVPFLIIQRALEVPFLCPQRNFGRHIVIALSVPPSVPLRVRCISSIFFEVGIPNLVCGCILG